MKQLLKKYIAICLLGILCIQLTGCGQAGENNTSKDSAGQETYLAEKLSLPEYSYILGECTYENTLYYGAAAFDQENQINNWGIYGLDMGAEGAKPQRLPAMPDMDEQEYLQKMTVDDKGMIYFISGRFLPDEEKPEAITLTKMDQEGNILSAWDITQYFEDQEYFTITGFEVDQAGNVFFSNLNNEIYVQDEKGNLMFQVNAEGNVSQICRGRSGTMFMTYWGRQGMEMKEIDLTEKGLGKKHELPQSGSIKLAMGTDSDLIISTEATVYDYDSQTMELLAKFDWMSCNIVTDYMGVMLSLTDGRILLINKDYADLPVKVALSVIRKAGAEEVTASEKTVLTIGGISLFIESGIRNAVVEFNETNTDYMIEIKEYGDEDIEAGIAQLNADIVSGSGPDILILPVRFSMDMYAEKGVLEDLYPYIDNDKTLDREDFILNIIKAHETEGKLYGIPITFSVATMMGKTSVVGDRSGWNLDEMIAFADSCPEGSPIFDDASKSGIMRICRYANWDQLVDWNSEKNPFNRELYIKMLTFSNRFTNDEQYVYDQNYNKKIMDEQLLLLDTSVSSPYSDAFYNALFGEPVTYVGYPSETGCGSVAYSSNAMAINANSPNKESAWELIESLLTKEFHANSDSFMGFSIRKDGLEKQFEESMEATYKTDSNGNKKEQAKGISSIGDYRLEIYASKKEEIEKLRRLIENVDRIRTTDTQIGDIIAEEAQMYFNGSKTAEEVADIVENRIQVYLNENK